jgi:SAM-dependent methyltransferase
LGIDIHNLNLLAVAQDRGVRFDRTMAIGRQAVHVEPRLLELHRRHRALPPLTEADWFEPLLRQWYGSSETDSIDASAYEGAGRVHDMNQPLPEGDPARGHYDAVLDFGCLEHVFDFPTAWRNVVALARTGGHILHALPCNNLAGHGFYQFSPELFFSLYRPERGFELKGVWAAIRTESRHWWVVANPMTVRRRVNLACGHEVYLLVLVRKLAEMPQQAAPQQSDYEQLDWQGAPAMAGSARGPHPATGALEAVGMLDIARRWRDRLRAVRGAALDLPAPDFRRVAVAELAAPLR